MDATIDLVRAVAWPLALVIITLLVTHQVGGGHR